MEQSTEREEENYDEIQQEIQDNDTVISQKTQKKVHQVQKPKKLQKIHKIPHCKKNP